MAKFWFASAPLVSHTDWGGFLKTAQALSARGHNVTWVSEARIGGWLARNDLPFAPVRETGWLWPPPPAPDLSTLAPQEAMTLRYTRALDTWLSENLVGEAVAALLELAEQIGRPDMMVTDPFLSAAALAAEALDAPLVVCGWPAQGALDADRLFPVQQTLGSDGQGRIDRLCERFGLQGVNFDRGPTPAVRSPHAHINYFSRSWFAAEEHTLLWQNEFVGGAPAAPDDPPPPWLLDIPQGQPLALVTLGTVFTGDLGFFSWAAQAAARAGLTPLVVLGWNPIDASRKAELKAALPTGTRLLNWAPFEHVLPRTKLIIHHGGMGTTHAAVVHGIPQIVVPHAADQRAQARRVAQAKVGLNLSAHDVQQGLLFDAALALTQDEKVQTTARQLAEEFRSLGGPQRAAELLADLTVQIPDEAIRLKTERKR